MPSLIEKFIIEISKLPVVTRQDFQKFQRKFSKENQTPFFTVDQLVNIYHNLVANGTVQADKNLDKLLTLKSTRSDSGIVVVTVLTKPYDCPGNCLYCPTQKNVPKSYLSNEPAVMRAIMNGYDPYKQTISRLKALDAVGHLTNKVNIRIVGATWSYYPPQYQTWFIKRVFEAANDFRSKNYELRIKDAKTLEQLQKINETAHSRLVEISVETRQDYINIAEIKRLRKLGVTKVELGTQSIFDDVLKFNRRGNLDKDTVAATKMLKDAGFKVSYQMMLNLPSSTFKKDLEMFKTLFSDSRYCPDHLKIYPLALVKEANVYDLYKEGKFKPYSREELIDLISQIKQYIPYYCRIERVIRDIPAEMIVEGGAKVSNLRQEVFKQLVKDGKKCKCIRCREVKSGFDLNQEYKMFRQDYDSNDGRDIFLSIESSDRSKLLTMLRLRIPSQHFSGCKHFIKTLDNSSLIREIHTYGPQVSPLEKNDSSAQHQGFGKQLIKEAERISKQEFGVDKISVIAGVGVREYFKKQGFHLVNTYMQKDL